VDQPDQMKMLPLHYAADHDSAEAANILLADPKAKGAIDAQDEDECTALHHAAYMGRLDVVRALLDAGAATDKEDKKGNTALADAKEKGHHDVATVLATATPAEDAPPAEG
jgi:ankyrin repeat protein